MHRVDRPLYCFLGYHKCATTFLDQNVFQPLFASLHLRAVSIHAISAANYDINAFLDAGDVDFLAYVNAEQRYVEEIERPIRAVRIVRDPRDVIVSAYFSHLHSHATEGWPELVEHRSNLSALDEEQGLLAEIDFMKTCTVDGYDVMPIQNMAHWDNTSDSILTIRYEDFARHPEKVVADALTFLGLYGVGRHVIGEDQLHELMQSTTFASVGGGRQPGEEDTTSHYRKGVPNDWINHFTGSTKEAFKEAFGDAVLNLGYETSTSW